MTDHFMNEYFWDHHSQWNKKLTLRDAWNAAVNKVASHLQQKQAMPAAEAHEAASEWLEDVVHNHVARTLGLSKDEAVDGVAYEYQQSTDLEATIASDSPVKTALNAPSPRH